MDAFDGELSPDENAVLESMMDAYITSTNETIEKIDRLMTRMDETHEMLKEHNNGVS